MPGAPLVVGLTGGIGSGKSEALRAFGRHGAATLSSDVGVRTLYTREPVKRAMLEHFGPAVFTPEGEIDRRAVGAIVFADAAELRWLEGCSCRSWPRSSRSGGSARPTAGHACSSTRRRRCSRPASTTATTSS